MKMKFHKTVFLIPVFVVMVSVGMAGTLWACAGAGPFKHIGGVTFIDAKAKTFTIRDAETDQLMTFKASGKVLEGLKIKNRVLVSYKEENGKMIATEVQS